MDGGSCTNTGAWDCYANNGSEYGAVGGTGYCAGDGASYPGGLLMVYAKSVINNNIISANGSDATPYVNWRGGGGSGGGSINIFYNEEILNGTMIAQGGSGVNYSGNGGDGSITVGQIEAGVCKVTYKNY